MNVFIPKDSGLVLDDMKLVKNDVETNKPFTMFKVFTDVQIPYDSPKNDGKVLKGDIYSVPTRVVNISYRGLRLQPAKVTVVGMSRKVVYIYVLVPLSDLPLSLI